VQLRLLLALGLDSCLEGFLCDAVHQSRVPAHTTASRGPPYQRDVVLGVIFAQAVQLGLLLLGPCFQMV
jgi:hypothetical protein